MWPSGPRSKRGSQGQALGVGCCQGSVTRHPVEEAGDSRVLAGVVDRGHLLRASTHGRQGCGGEEGHPVSRPL